MTDTTKEIKDIVAELNKLSPADDIANSENWNMKNPGKKDYNPAQLDAEALDSLVNEADGGGKNTAAQTETQNEPDKFKNEFEEIRAIRTALPHMDFDAASKAENERGAGLDLGITFFRRTGDNNTFKDKGDEEPILFKGINFICARTGGHKTFLECSLAAQIIYTFANANPPKTVIFITLEETANDIIKHIVTAYNKFKYDALNKDENKHRYFTENELTAALLDKLNDNDKLDAIKSAYSEISDKLIVIDRNAFDEAAEAVFQTGKANAGERTSLFERNGTTKNVNEAYIAKLLMFDAIAEYGAENVVFFIDYAQLMRDSDGAKSAASYKELQAVAGHLNEAAQKNALIFITAQMNREGVRGANAQKSIEEKKAAEFFGAIAENTREAADLEHVAHKIIYLTACDILNDDGNPEYILNMRTLKNRGGTQYLYASARIHHGYRVVDIAHTNNPIWQNETGSRAPRRKEGTETPPPPPPKAWNRVSKGSKTATGTPKKGDENEPLTFDY